MEEITNPENETTVETENYDDLTFEEIFDFAWTPEDIVNLFQLLKDLEVTFKYLLGGVFGLLALLLVLIFFVTFKK